jgi:lipoprotein-anchoring transpeptidase ErfK/SrfK
MQLGSAGAPSQAETPESMPVGTAVASAPDGSPEATSSAPQQTPTPLPSPTPMPVVLLDRDNCDVIRGTSYHSDAERAWYLENCITPVATVPAPAPPAIPGPEVAGERWILVDIASQTATAMIGEEALYAALVTTGVDGWNTPTGTWNIVYRVENETMTSASIGAEEYYVLEDVLYTQYFTTVGHALHLNYWRSDDYFGSTRSSHGCVGMRLADAEFFWHFATNGTRVTVQ